MEEHVDNPDTMASPRLQRRRSLQQQSQPPSPLNHDSLRQSDNDEDDISPYQRYTVPKRRPTALKRAARVSRHAAMTTKQVVWDSNDASIDVALTAVDQWEALYTGVKHLVVQGCQQATRLYATTKAGAGSLEHGILVPVRDWILLPAFIGVERLASETTSFLQSPQARHLASESLHVARQVPWVGEHVLAPTLCFSVGLVERSWQVLQYPIPSRQAVRDTVDVALNASKWALTTAAREIVVYAKRADANITRTLSHTQWKCLGSGPYATLDKLNKRVIMDHLCERYLSAQHAMARYELAAHVRAQNPALYHDLVLTGVLRERGGELTQNDEWLSTCPSYRALETPFLLGYNDQDDESNNETTTSQRCARVQPLWFRLPYVNGKRPSSKDVPWVCFRAKEQGRLEARYRQVLVEGQAARAPVANDGAAMDPAGLGGSGLQGLDEQPESLENKAFRYPTIAKWYVPDPETDVLVDQQRHAVSFSLCCLKCREEGTNENNSTTSGGIPPLVQTHSGELCPRCQSQAKDMPLVAALLSPPPVAARMRPTLWRFHGPGDAVRRATWLLDTPRHGLQPFDEEAQAVLEDAYLFLKWMSLRQEFHPTSEDADADDLDSALLTVEVPCPDGTERLVQFSSLTQATAIQKGLGASMTLFKRRVYRGAWLEQQSSRSNVGTGAVAEADETELSIEESILQAVQEKGALGETLVPDTSIRAVVTPRVERRVVIYSETDTVAASMAVPPSRLSNEDMAKYLNDDKEGNIDHLVLIVHGIGEMLRSIDVFGLALPNLSSIIDCCAYLRKNHAEVQEAHFSQMYPTADATSRASTGRVEYLPVEWHEAFSILSQRRDSDGLQQKQNVMLRDLTLRTIPNMREFANDTLMDVLYFMSPEHHDIIIDVVTNEMNVVVQMFKQLTGFRGRVSIVGHSLGSIISWDILDNQNIGADTPIEDSSGLLQDVLSRDPLSHNGTDSVMDYASARSEDDGTPELTPPTREPIDPSSDYPQLEFVVDNFFLLGSPVAVFLMIRNQRQPLTEDFYLRGCNRVFNIFHPYDPIAYRIEPCIDPRNADFEPTIMKHWNGGFRVHYQTKRLWRKLMDTTWKTQQSVVEAFEASMAGMGLLDTADGLADDDTGSEISSDDNARGNRVVCGLLNRGRRIDYMLQEKEVENANEYVAALTAHSSYWIERDLSLFFARQIYLSTLEQAAAASWEPVPVERSS